jgi:hypothetical protein
MRWVPADHFPMMAVEIAPLSGTHPLLPGAGVLKGARAFA